MEKSPLPPRDIRGGTKQPGPSPVLGLSCPLDWEPDIPSDLRLSRCTYPHISVFCTSHWGRHSHSKWSLVGGRGSWQTAQGGTSGSSREVGCLASEQGQWLGVQAVGPALLPYLRLGLNSKGFFRGQCALSSCGAAPFLS